MLLARSSNVVCWVVSPMTTRSLIRQISDCLIGSIEQGLGDNQVFRVMEGELPVELSREVDRVDCRNSSTEGGDRMEHDDVLDAVRREERDDVTLSNSLSSQAGCSAINRISKLAVCELTARMRIDQRRFIGQPVCVPQHQ